MTRALEQAPKISRRGFLFGAASLPAASVLGFEQLQLRLTETALIVQHGPQEVHFALAGFGRQSRTHLLRDGSRWLFQLSHARVPGLARKLTLDLTFHRRAGGWEVVARSQGAARAKGVDLADWLGGLKALPVLERFTPDDQNQNLAIAGDGLSIFATASGGIIAQGREATPVALRVGALGFQANLLTWQQTETTSPAWHLAMEGLAAQAGQLAPVALDQTTQATFAPAGLGRGALEISADRRRADIFYWDGPAELGIEGGVPGTHGALRIANGRAALRLARGAPTYSLWAANENISGRFELGKVGLSFGPGHAGALTFDTRAGRAQSGLELSLGLAEVRVGVEGADMAQWSFPGTETEVKIGAPAADHKLYLANGNSDPADEDDDEVPNSFEFGHGGTDFFFDARASLLHLFRARDLLNLKFGFSNFRLERDPEAPTGARLTPYGTDVNPPLLVAHFDPQHIEEEVYDTLSGTGGPEEIAEARAAAPSRIAFRIDAGLGPMPLTLEAFTRWQDLALHVSGRAFSPNASVLEQLEYVGIGKNIGRRRAMELIRASVEADRTHFDAARPDSLHHLKTAIEARYRMVLSPSGKDSRMMTVATSQGEAELRGSQLWSARVVPAPPPLPEQAPDPIEEEGKDGAAPNPTPRATSAPKVQSEVASDPARDLRVIWVRGVDLGHLHGRDDVPEEDDVAPWSPAAVEDQPGTIKFNRAMNARQARDMMTMTSVYGLMAKRRLKAFYLDTNTEVPLDQLALYFDEDPSNDPARQLSFRDDEAGHVVAPPEGYTYAGDLLGTSDITPEEMGIVRPPTLGPSQIVMTAWGASVSSHTSVEPYAHVASKDSAADYVAPQVELFEQESLLGEDLFVAVAEKGFLVPTGHRAAVLQITRREIGPNAAHKNDAKDADNTAYLIKRTFITVGKPSKVFPALGQPFGGRAGPGRHRIALRNAVSPEIRPPDANNAETGAVIVLENGQPEAAFAGVFWPRQTKMTGTAASDVFWEFDLDDDPGVHQAGLLFVPNNKAQDPESMARIARYYRNAKPEARVVQSFDGVHAYAPGKDTRQTSFATRSMHLSVSGRAAGVVQSYAKIPGVPVHAGNAGTQEAQVLGKGGQNPAENFTISALMEGADQPGFYPVIERARVRVQSIERLKGQSHGLVTTSLSSRFVEHGFDPANNPSELFLDVLSPLPLNFSGEGAGSGGFARPNMEITNLSRTTGPVGGKKRFPPAADAAEGSPEAEPDPFSDFALGNFNPVEFLSEKSNILGIFTLQSVLKTVGVNQGATKIEERTGYDVESGTGGTVFDKLKAALDEAIVLINQSVDTFLSRMKERLPDLAGDDGQLTLSDLYPGLAKSYEALLEAIDTAVAEATRLANQLPKDTVSDKQKKEAIEKARQELRLVVSGLVTGVDNLKVEIQSVIDNPMPPVVRTLISDLEAEFRKLEQIVTSDVGALLEERIKAVLDDLILAGVEATLPFSELFDETKAEAARTLAVLLGYARQSEANIRAEILERVNDGLDKLPGKPNATETEVNEYIDILVASDTKRLKRRVQEDLHGYKDDLVQSEVDLLRDRSRTLLGEAFAGPLAELRKHVIKVLASLKSQSQDVRKTITRELVALLDAALDAALESTALSEISKAYEQLVGLCPLVAQALLSESEPLFGHFDRAEEQVLRLEEKVRDLKMPSGAPQVADARGKVLQSANRARQLLKDGRFLVKAVRQEAGDIKNYCLQLKELEPINQLFSLQASAVQEVLSASEAMGDMIDAIDLVLRSDRAAEKTFRTAEMTALKAAVIDATGEVMGAIEEATGLARGVDFSSLGNLAELVKIASGQPGFASLKRHAEDFTEAANRAVAAAKALRARFQNVSTPKQAAELAGDILAFAGQENQAVARFLAQSTALGDDVLGKVETWSRDLMREALEFSLPVWSDFAVPTMDAITGAIVTDQGPTRLGFLVDGAIAAELLAVSRALRAEAKGLAALRALLDKDNADQIRARLEALRAKPLVLPQALEVLGRLEDMIRSGDILDLPSLAGLRDEITRAIRRLLPVQVGVVFPWQTKLGDFPPSKPIFEIITPDVDDENGKNILNNDRYWMVDDEEGGERYIRDIFYPEVKGSIDWSAFRARRGDLILDAGASYHFLTKERRAWADSWLHPFSINVLPGFDVVTLHFRAATFTASLGQGAKLNALPEDFAFGEMVKFIQALSRYLSGGGETGPYYDINLLPPKIEVGVRFDLPTIPLGPLIFSNLSLNVSAIMPLDDGEILFKASVGRRDKPFTISVPPYGGGGHIGLTANKKIVGFEASMEYGGVVPFELGPIKAFGQVTAGIYIEKNNSGLTIISGFVRTIGEGKIAIFSLSFHIELSLTHINGAMYGRVFVSFTFKVKFFEVTYSFQIERKISGGAKESARIKRVEMYRELRTSNWGRPLVRVHAPARMVQWNKYRARYPAGLVLPKTIAGS